MASPLNATRASGQARPGCSATGTRAAARVFGHETGVSIGQDGPSQMALEDLAAFRALHGSTVLNPCDANQAAGRPRPWRTDLASATCA